MKRFALVVTVVILACGFAGPPSPVNGAPSLAPLLAPGRPVDWWFVFKFNARSFPGCGENAKRQCSFGGKVQLYRHFGQQYIFASSENSALQKGSGCAGASTDPVAATFGQIYHGSVYYVVWNDQFYRDPAVPWCRGDSCGAPWGHSKGVVAWDDGGSGLVMQVSTPSWPASGNARAPRKRDGNTLGCVKNNNVMVSQHFFALKLTKDDLLTVLKALHNASVVTVPGNPQVVRNGGPPDVQAVASTLGTRSDSPNYTLETLSSGVQLISKPSRLHVPPWQMVSALLGGVGIRTATWWAKPKIYTSGPTTKINCWDDSLKQKPGRVEIALTGIWDEKEFHLEGVAAPGFNHAKIGVSTTGDRHYSIFGDLNQQGALSGMNCWSSQNGRGGLFYVLDDKTLFNSISHLIADGTASTRAPRR